MENNQTLDEIKKLLLDVIAKVDQQNEKIKTLENRMLVVEQSKINEKSNSTPAEETLPLPYPKEQIELQTEPQKQEINLVEPLKEADKENFEERLGGKWFARIGIAVLLIGVSLFFEVCV